MEKTLVEKALDAKKSTKEENKFIRTMEPKVKKVSRFYAYSIKGGEEFIEDFENAARMGIHNALERFDFSYGGFDSYLEESMRMEIRNFMNSSTRLIRLPKHMIESINRIRAIDGKDVNGDRSINEIILEGLDVKNKKLKLLKIRDAMKTEECYSLDWDYNRENGENSRTLSLFIPATDNTERDYEKKEIEESLKKAIDQLSPNEKHVIQYSYGLNGSKKTNKTIAKELGVCVGTVTSWRRLAENKIRTLLLCG